MHLVINALLFNMVVGVHQAKVLAVHMTSMGHLLVVKLTARVADMQIMFIGLQVIIHNSLLYLNRTLIF